MKAEQFIKDHGYERAREVVEGAPVGVVNFSFEDGDITYFKENCYFDNDYDDWFEIYFMMPDLALFSELKRLVESVDLIEKEGGIEFAIQLLTWGDTSVMTEEHGNRLAEAVRDYESIYGEGNETN